MNKQVTLPALPTVDPEGGLTRYFREIWKFPILTNEQEFMLAVRWREHDDVNAAHELVTSHLRLVAKIAMGYRGYGLSMPDLISEGNIGLMTAVKKFEPRRGFRLATYAMWWIRASITEYVLRSWSMVKMGTVAAQKKLFFSLNRTKRDLNILSSGELSPEQVARVAEALEVSQEDVIDMNRRLAARDVSLNASRASDDSDGVEYQDVLVDERPDPEEIVSYDEELDYRRSLLHRAMSKLSDRERHILRERKLAEEPKTLEEIGIDYGISRERVRQLEARAMQKLEKTINDLAIAGPKALPMAAAAV